MAKEATNLRLDKKLLAGIREKAATDETTITSLIEQGMRLVLGIAPVETSAEMPVEAIEGMVKASVEQYVEARLKAIVEPLVKQYVEADIKAKVDTSQQPGKITPREDSRGEPVVSSPNPPGLDSKPESPTESRDREEEGELLTTEELATRLGMVAGSLRAAKSKGAIPLLRNGWKATPTEIRQGKGFLWRVSRVANE